MTAAPPAPLDPGLIERARALHRRVLVGDIHTHMLLSAGYLGYDVTRPRRFQPRWSPLKNLTDLVTIERAVEGGVGLLVFVVYVAGVDWRGYRRVMWRMIERFDRLMERYRGAAVHARSVAEVERARAEGRLACMLALEGGHAVERELGELARLREVGVTYLTLTHFVDNDLSGAAMHPGSRRGLTGLGREAIRELNRLGILVDVTHCTKEAAREAYELSAQPVIYSHTGLQRFVPPSRMTTDDELRAVGAQGGLVGLMLSPYFVTGRMRGGADDAVRALEHAIDLAGEDAVAIGSDLCSGLPPLDDVPDIGAYERLTAAMLARGWSEERIAKVWSGSFLGLLRRVGW